MILNNLQIDMLMDKLLNENAPRSDVFVTAYLCGLQKTKYDSFCRMHTSVPGVENARMPLG